MIEIILIAVGWIFCGWLGFGFMMGREVQRAAYLRYHKRWTINRVEEKLSRDARETLVASTLGPFALLIGLLNMFNYWVEYGWFYPLRWRPHEDDEWCQE